MKRSLKIIIIFLLINMSFLISVKINATSEKLIENGFYQIKSKLSETAVVDISAASYENGANAQIWANNLSANQRFKFVYNAEGYYRIQAVHSKKYLEIIGTSVRQYTKSDTDTQKWILEKAENEYYYIKSVAGNKYLTLNNGIIIANDYTGNENQKFKMSELATLEMSNQIEEGYYTISSGLDETKALDINGVSKLAGANIQLWSKNNGTNQIFKIKNNNDGTYVIESILSKKVLEVSEGAKNIGANVQQGNLNNEDSEKWILTNAGDGYYNIISYDSGLVVNVVNGKIIDGTNIDISIKDGTNKQKFKFNKIEIQKSEKLIENGYYQLEPKTTGAGVIEVAGANNNDGANAQIWANNRAMNQIFKLIYNEKGYYTIQVLNSEKYLETIGKVVQQYSENDIETQKWIIIESEEKGYYNIISLANNGYLGIYGYEGAVAVYDYTGSDNQKFKINQISTLEGKQTIEEGYYTISSGLDELKALDIDGVSKLAGANIHLWSKNNGTNQIFEIKYNNDGTYKIQSILSKMVLEVQGGIPKNGANVVQGEFCDESFQKWIIADDGNGYYNIISANTALVMEVANGKTIDGTNVQIAISNNSNRQKFKFNKIEIQKSEKLIENGYYQLEPKTAGAGVIEVAGATNKDGANAQIWANNKTMNQRFKLIYNEEGYYTIQVLNSEKYLETIGKVVQQYSKNNIETQKWILKESEEEGYYNIISLANNGYLGVYGYEGAVAVYDYTGSDNQKIKISKLATLEGKQTVEDGYYMIKSALDKNKVLDVEGASTAAGANILLYSKSARNNQKFKFIYNGDGTYTIKSVKSNKVLGLEASSKSDGININQQYENRSDLQKWIVEETENGNYNIISYYSGALIDVAGGKAIDCANIQVYVNLDNTRQEFTLEKVDAVEGSKTIETGNYRINVFSAKDLVIGVSEFSKNDFANIETLEKASGTNQKFIIEYKENGFYKISVAHSNKVIQVNGNDVIQNTSYDTEEQEWVITKNKDGSYSIISAHNGLYLEVEDSNYISGASIQIAEKVDTYQNQKFIFEVVDIETGTQSIKDGTYRISSCLDNEKVIDIDNASKEAGANVLLWTKNNGINQNFRITYKGNGYYKIIASCSNHVLGMERLEEANKVNIAQFNDNDTVMQEWIIKPVGDGYYNIIAASNNYYLQTANQGYSNGTNIEVGIKDGTAAQKFKIENLPIQAETGTYGISGLYVKGDSRGTNLKYYKIGHGENVLFTTFSVHGFEDSWANDGLVLTEIAEKFKSKLVSMQDTDLMNKWTIYIFPSVNPDGATYGTSNNGPGRTTFYSAAPNNKGIDINRNWHIDGTTYQRYTSSRNYNGTAGFQAYEARYLRDFLLNHKSQNGQTILIDTHGWLNETIGDSEIASYYQGNFGITKHISTYGNGYLINWARSSLGTNGKAAKSMLLELPMVNNYNEFVNSGFTDKFINSTINMLRNINY